MAFEAVIFDLGGVILPSPFEAWARYEEELGLDVGFIRRVVHASGDHGAWARHERGELPFDAFVAAFEEECRAAGGDRVSGVEVMTRLLADPSPRPEMVTAIERIRDAGLRTAGLTNNWADPDDVRERSASALAPLFDVLVESAVEGLRKPDPRIYHLTCERLGVTPDASVFLDDLGVNLKPARELGMHTIKVVDPRTALEELEAALGIPLS
ncbi:MAG TPA: HAD-IA family hydrolase [Acidimicrobiia bacterium]|nr:HAD-IA family hydrolase [Acidimicrobiia bacterium]